MNKEQKVVCKCLAGSHMYGLNTADSDIDTRGVFLNGDLQTIIGFGRRDHQDLRMETGEDFFMYEFRRYLQLLAKADTGALELLFNDKWEYVSNLFVYMQENKNRLINSARVIVALTGGPKAEFKEGYIGGEMRLATGQRTGKLGGKRKAALDRFGYSPKNFVQMIRLAFCGAKFYETGVFPTNIKEANTYLHEKLLDIKTHPEAYTKEELVAETEQFRDRLVDTYKNSTVNFEYDDDFADELCLLAYRGFLRKTMRSEGFVRMEMDMYTDEILKKSSPHG